MQLLHARAKTRAVFDDPNLIACTGLAPLMALAEQAGLAALTAAHVRPGGDAWPTSSFTVSILAPLRKLVRVGWVAR